MALSAAGLVLTVATCSGAGLRPIAHQVQHQAGVQTPQPGTATPVGSGVEQRRIGASVEHRPIFAYRLGNPGAAVTAVVLGNMHGSEPAGVQVARAIIGSPAVRGIDLWVIPTMNPDGLAAHTRQNARGVDLNRNWGYRWVRQAGMYDSGPRPFSEPETRAVKTFLDHVHASFVVSFHQPLYGVDSDHVKNPRLMNRLALDLHLPRKPFTCQTGVCHGTMTGWFNAHHAGAAITVEFGSAPTHSYLTGPARAGTVRAVLGRYR